MTGPDQGGVNELESALVAAIRKGAGGTGVIAARVKQSKPLTKRRLDAMAKQGLVHSLGSRRSQMWHIGGRAASRGAAKEEHS